MAYTEFYTQNGGSNLNAGSTTNNTALYTSIHGNWVNATGVFTPTDGVNPVSAGVAVGMFASVYVDGATEGVSISRITAVTNAVNGAITANNSRIGTKPANQTGTATMKVGGAWLGPNAASGFPLTLATYGANVDSSAHMSCLNLKNDQTYTMTASFAVTTGGGAYLVQGYTTSVRDGGRATFDGTTSTGALITDTGISGSAWTDIIFTTSITSGATDLVITTRSATFQRCVFKGSRQSGFSTTAGVITLIECEAYGNCTAGTASTAGFKCVGTVAIFIRCVAHDNTIDGFFGSGTGSYITLINCIADTNATGVDCTTAGAFIFNSDFYNHSATGIIFASGNTGQVWIENCNFVLNVSAGINSVSAVNSGFVYNCGYGSGTQANGADSIGNLQQSGTVTYAANVTPWVDPANGDFSINLSQAQSAGRGAFTETASSYTGTVGYPDIGAAQSLIIPNLRIPSMATI